MRLDNKIAFVTGAAMGIGGGIAEQFVEAGATVVVFDVNADKGREMAEGLSRRGRALAIHGDVSSEEDVKQAMARTVQEFGALDVLVNNAGIEFQKTVVDLPTTDWNRQIAVNLTGIFLCCKYAIPYLRGRNGAIVNISSVHAFISYELCAGYDATKAGVIGMTRAMALDHAHDGIRVNAVCPGYIYTPMMEAWLKLQPDREATMRQILSVNPLGRIGTPRDVAQAVLFLASDDASFITGTSLVVDGAMTVAGH